MKKVKVVYRNAVIEDVVSLGRLEKLVWGEEMSADDDKWISRINIFSEGIFVADRQGEIVGVIVGNTMKWDYEDGYYPDWFEATDSGFITNHSGSGDVIYGVDFTVLPNYPGVASVLMRMMIDLMRRTKGARGIMGCRIPSLRKRVELEGLQDFDSSLVEDCAKKDVEVKFFLQHGFKMINVRKDYFLPDYESMGWGVILEVR